MIVPTLKLGFVPALLCVGWLGLCGAGVLRAADDATGGKDSAAQKSAADERADEERKLTGAKYTNYTGTITLLSDAELQARGDDLVIAKFATGEGESLFLKPNNEEIKATIKASNGKALILKARCLKDGKYIFAIGTVQEAPGSGFVPALGGL